MTRDLLLSLFSSTLNLPCPEGLLMLPQGHEYSHRLCTTDTAILPPSEEGCQMESLLCLPCRMPSPILSLLCQRHECYRVYVLSYPPS